LDADGLRHVGLRMASGQQQDNLPPPDQAGSKGGRPLPPFQRLTLFGGQDNA
jgi:hypothetical protein